MGNFQSQSFSCFFLSCNLLKMTRYLRATFYFIDFQQVPSYQLHVTFLPSKRNLFLTFLSSAVSDSWLLVVSQPSHTNISDTSILISRLPRVGCHSLPISIFQNLWASFFLCYLFFCFLWPLKFKHFSSSAVIFWVFKREQRLIYIYNKPHLIESSEAWLLKLVENIFLLNKIPK